MKLFYMFSKNNKFGSRLISWSSGFLIKDLEKVPSHSAILMEFDNIKESFIVESTLNTGIRIVPYSKWLEINEQCYKIECNKNLKTDEVFARLVTVWNKKYDWYAFTYFGWCFMKYLIFKIPFPKENSWQKEDRFLCTEVIGIVDSYNKYAMVTPAKMCSDLLKREN